jgi:cupin fold WbuC family metalloprotein
LQGIKKTRAAASYRLPSQSRHGIPVIDIAVYSDKKHTVIYFIVVIEKAGKMKLVTSRMVDALIAQAGKTKRLRINYNIHESLSDPVQRLFIAADLSSYFRPHRHPGKSEFAIVIRGLFDVIFFDNDGAVTERITAGPGMDIFAMEIPADQYHTWIPMAEQSVFFEVKEGPYDPTTSLVFAPWSPAEGSPQVEEFQAKLLALHTGDRVL